MTPPGPDTDETFAFEWEPVYLAAAAVFTVRPSNSDVTVGADHLEARFGPWTVRVPRARVTGTQVTGPYGLARTMGPARLSLADRGLTFATNRHRGLCIHFAEPVRGIDPLGRIRHPALTVTVDNPAALSRALGFDPAG
jgi:hypothetical protein